MARLSASEFAFGEFAAYEFAQEKSAIPAIASFAISSESQLVLEAGALALVSLASAGQSIVNLSAQALENVGFTVIGSVSDFQPAGSMILGAALSSVAGATPIFISGYKSGGTFAMEGSSATNIGAFDGIMFSIAGSSEVVFLTGAISNAGLSIAGIASSLLNTSSTVVTQFNPEGVTTVAWKNHALIETNLSISAAAAASFAMRKLANAQLTVEASSAMQVRAQGVIPTGLQSAGVASLAWQAAAAAMASFAPQGTGSFNIQSVAIREGVLESSGLAIVEIRPGKPVTKNMAPAFDIVIRPVEDRSATWKNSMSILKRFTKQPRDLKDYDISLSAWLAPVNDTLDDVEVTINCITDPTNTSLVVDTTRIQISETAVKLWIGGGTDQHVYKISLLAKTINGREDENELIFTVRDT